MSVYVQESKDNAVDVEKFNIDDLEIGSLTKKDFPETSDTAGSYFVSSLQYNYTTERGRVKGALLLRLPRLRAPNGIRPQKNKKEVITGHSITLKLLKGDPHHVKLMDVLHQIYVKCVQFLNTESACSIVGDLSKFYTEDLDLQRIANPKTRWGGLSHPLFYDKIPTKINVNANPIWSASIRKNYGTGSKTSKFLKPYKQCVTCGPGRECSNTKHIKLPVCIDQKIVNTAGFDGIPVVAFKDLCLTGSGGKIRCELDTFTVIELESKEMSTTEGETIDSIERSQLIDSRIFEEKLHLLADQNSSSQRQPENEEQGPEANENDKEATQVDELLSV
jgi:hypothetical protein